MKITNNRAVAIVRVSTAEQAREERYSIPHQKTHILEECRHRGLEMLHFFEFVHSGATVLSSASKEKADILAFIRDYSISIVMVHELDRLSRSMLDTLLFVDDLNKLDVAFISIHDGFDTTTAQGQLQMHILSAFSEYFRKQLASKVLGGMIERAKQGKHMGKLPLGYKIGPEGFEVDDEGAKIVKMVYSLYLDQNVGMRGIADYLNGMGLRGRQGNRWSHATIRDILENEIYAGTFTWSNVRVEDNHPAIIDRETWGKVQERRRLKKGLGGRAQNSFYLLSGLLRCGVCGESTMVGRHARKGKFDYRYYTCNNYASKGKDTCPAGYIRADRLEEFVLEDIRDFAQQLPTELHRETIPADYSLIKEKIALQEKELSRLKLMLNRAAEAYEEGQYDLEYFSYRKEQINKQQEQVKGDLQHLQEQLEGKISQEEAEIRISDKIALAKSIINEEDAIKAKAKLQLLIDSIVVMSEDDVVIYYRL